MCLVKTLLGKTLWEKILVKEKSTHIFWYALFVASLKTLPGKPSRKKPRSREKECNAYYTPLIKHHLISCDDVSNLCTLWLVYSFFKEKPHISWYGVSFISTRRTFDLLHGGLLFLHSNICFIDRQNIIVPPHANT